MNDPKFIERAEILRDKGTNRGRFFRGDVDKYTWVDLGSSFLPSDILAAFLTAQLEAREEIQSKRQRVWNYYNENLWNWAQQNDVRLPTIPPHCEQSYHMFYMILPSGARRDDLIRHLKSRKALGVFHYFPLHLSAMGRKFGGVEGACPVSERISDRLVRLPFYNDLTEAEQARVVEAVCQFK